MPRSALCLFVAVSGIGLGALSACFVRPSPPPGFRHSCDADRDCSDDDECIAGLCQRRCDANDEDPCEDVGDSVACVNGLCVDTCTADDDAPCQSPQECRDLSDAPIPPTDTQLFFLAQQGTELCFQPCGEDLDCPDGTECTQGLCLSAGLLPDDTGGDDDESGSDESESGE